MNRHVRKLVLCPLVLGTVLEWSAAMCAQAVSSKSVEAAASGKSDSSMDPPPVRPGQPSSNIPDITLDPASVIPDLPPLPAEKASLIGGTIQSLDRVRDQLTIQVFGGGRMKTLFDPRTRIYLDGKPGSIGDLKSGERIYADTILVDGQVFARNIRLGQAMSEGDGQGVVLSYGRDSGVLELRDLLSPKPLRIRLTSGTRILNGENPGSINDLVAGAQVSFKFQTEAGRVIGRQVSVLIKPGTEFSFAGRVITLDLRLGLLVLSSTADHKTYEVYVDPSVVPVAEELREGAEVTVLTRYDGTRYVARGLTVEPVGK